MLEILATSTASAHSRAHNLETPRERLVAAHEKYTGTPLNGFEAFLFYGLLNARQIQEKLKEFEDLEKLKSTK